MKFCSCFILVSLLVMVPTRKQNHNIVNRTISNYFVQVSNIKGRSPSNALSAAEICYKYNSYYGSYYSSYCSGYCAGSTFSEYCLYYYYKDGESGGGSTTIVISIGCIGGLGFFVICCFCVFKFKGG